MTIHADDATVLTASAPTEGQCTATHATYGKPRWRR